MSDHPSNSSGSDEIQLKIRRHQTAIRRLDLSKPVRLAIEAGLLTPSTTFFDYGCGRGDDLRGLEARGITCSGWDPALRPQGEHRPADIVNLGYVVNVIEDAAERSVTLRNAWGLANQVLIVSARLDSEAKRIKAQNYSDGYVTRLKTFQRFYSQGELRSWIDSTLGVESVAVAPGIFFIFRDRSLAYAHAASQYRQRVSIPVQRRSDELFDQYRDVLKPLMDFVANRGRLPEDSELGQSEPLREAFGSVSLAFAVVRRVTGEERWKRVGVQRSEDLLVYLALARFGTRPRFSELPNDMQLDIKALFGTYTRACDEADRLLFSSGDMQAVNAACKVATCGKSTPSAFYVHVSSVGQLPPILRVYEGCARRYIGVVDGANLIKLHREKPQVSYLSYPEFDEDPHPSLVASLIVPLQTFEVRYNDYAASDNPFILHRKEDFVHTAYPGRDKFARLTRQEEKHNLYEDTTTIGTRNGWNERLREKGLCLRGHRLVRQTTPPPGDTQS